MPDRWKPDLPPCVTFLRAADWLTIRDTPAPFGRNLGSVAPGAIVRIDPEDTCLLYLGSYRYIRLVSEGSHEMDEPAYIAIAKVEGRGYHDILTLEQYLFPHSSTCGNSFAKIFQHMQGSAWEDRPAPEPPPEIPEFPELPEHEMSELAEYQAKIVNASLPMAHDKLGTEKLLALLSPETLKAMQELTRGTSTPDVPDEEESDPVPEIPPVEEFPTTPPPPPVEEVPAPEPPPVVVSPAGFSTQGKKMLYKGKDLRGIMYNVREAIGAGDILPYFTPALLRRQFEVVRLLKGKAVRFYAAHVDLPAAEAARRAENVLNLLQEYGLFGVVALDEGAHSNFGIRKSAKNYQGKFTHDFWAGGFYEEYLPYTKEVVTRIGKHPALMILELANEPTTPHPPDPTTRQMDNMLNWMKVSSETFNDIAPGVIISPGWISAHEMASGNAYQGYRFAEKVYDLPYIKAGCIHTYQGMANRKYGDGEDHLKNEVRFNIPLYIGETGLQPELKDWGWLWKFGNDPLIVENFFMIGQWALMAHEGDIKEVRQVFDVGIGGPTGMVQTYDKGMPGFLWPEYVYTYTKLAETTFK